jgi:hypothetical protein
MTNVDFLRDLADRLDAAIVTPPNMDSEVTERLRKVAKLLIELDERDAVLTALENGGVDNWQGFELSLEDAGL